MSTEEDKLDIDVARAADPRTGPTYMRGPNFDTFYLRESTSREVCQVWEKKVEDLKANSWCIQHTCHLMTGEGTGQWAWGATDTPPTEHYDLLYEVQEYSYDWSGETLSETDLDTAIAAALELDIIRKRSD